MESRPRVAALLACHNRRDTTLACLHALHRQSALGAADLSTFLVDDGSSDGTGEAVKREFPHVCVLQGNGQLYWGGGMRLAWSEAFKGDYDYYLWLNDDTMLYPDALERVLATARSVRERDGADGIIVGSTRDAATGKTTYGGIAIRARFLLEFDLIEPGNEPVRCNAACGNATLVPAAIARCVGNFSGSFTHHLGDLDYALRAAKAGFGCWVVPGHIGECAAHDVRGSHLDASLPLGERARLMARASGPPPPREWMTFVLRHAGWRWPLYLVRTLVRSRLPRLWLTMRSRDPRH